MTTAFIFPGQGSQKVGMGAAFITGFKSGCDTIDEIEDAISYKISKLITEGPMEELTLTQNAQIAIFSISMAILNVLKHEFGYNIENHVKYMAGHSLGEYTALCSASVLSLRDASVIIRKRGELMAQTASGDNFRMAAILGLPIDQIEELVKPYQNGKSICVIANDNSDSQVIISGHASTVESVSQNAITAGAKKVMPLKTSGPFHSPLMAKATIALDEIITQFTFNDFKVPVISNVTANPIEDKDQVHALLVQQLTNRVRWRESVNFMVDNGIDRIVEIGPEKVLTKLNKRAHPEVDMLGIETIAEMEEFIGK